MSREECRILDDLIEVVVRSIPKERDAHNLYKSAAQRANSDMARMLFMALADQELEHETKLKAVLRILEKEKERLAK
jgi:rubrerythrin